MSKVQKFRKLPVVIEAMHWDGTAEDAVSVIQWILDGQGSAHYWDESDPGETISTIRIGTREGTMRAVAGDWIVKGVQGEFYFYKPNIFMQTYEEVESSSSVLDAEQRVLDTLAKFTEATWRYEDTSEEVEIAKHTNLKSYNAHRDAKYEYKKAQEELITALEAENLESHLEIEETYTGYFPVLSGKLKKATRTSRGKDTE